MHEPMHQPMRQHKPQASQPHAAPSAHKPQSRLWPLIALAAAATLMSACGGGGGGGSPSPAPVPPPPPPPPASACQPGAGTGSTVALSGVARAEIVPNTTGPLNYAGIAAKPIKGVTVQVLDGTSTNVLATTSTDANGAYSVSGLPSATCVVVRVRAQLLKTGAGPTWDVAVKDNTQANGAYVLDTTAFTTGTANLTKDVTAASGWGGTSYTGPRASGPFAITNTIYAAIQKVIGESPNQPIPTLSVYWSVNNVASGTPDPTMGLLATTYFTSSTTGGVTTRAIYVLGKADNDTDEFDETVIAHEWGHYFQNAFSRDDSVGGSHGGGDKLDGRVAFSEGWGNAWSGMALSRSTYTDSNGASQSKGFSINLAAPEVTANKGWYSEASVQYVLYTLSTQATGFTPIWQTMTAPAFVGGTALTQIHSFATALRGVNATAGANFGALLSGEQITAADAFASTETNSGGIASAIPIYRSTLTVGTPLTNVCTVSTAGVSNKLGNYVAFKFNATAKTYTITITGGAATDPDFEVYQNGFRGQAGASTLGSDTTTVTLAAGPAVLIFNDYNLAAGAAPSCFTINVQ
jgi:hypothetical protein